MQYINYRITRHDRRYQTAVDVLETLLGRAPAARTSRTFDGAHVSPAFRATQRLSGMPRRTRRRSLARRRWWPTVRSSMPMYQAVLEVG